MLRLYFILISKIDIWLCCNCCFYSKIRDESKSYPEGMAGWHVSGQPIPMWISRGLVSNSCYLFLFFFQVWIVSNDISRTPVF